jgi:PEP-CTERM motif
MTNRLRSFLLAGAACLGLGVVAPAYAIEELIPSQFVFIESDGYFTIINNSTQWYIYGFEVTDTDATHPMTTQPGWEAGACVDGCLLYENNTVTSPLPLEDDVGPGQSSSLFTFSLPEGSLPTFYVANSNGFEAGPFTPTGSAVPEPSTWAMVIGGFGFLGWRYGVRRSGLRRLIGTA